MSRLDVSRDGCFLPARRNDANMKILPRQLARQLWFLFCCRALSAPGCSSSDLYIQDIFPISSSEIVGPRDMIRSRISKSGQVPIHPSDSLRFAQPDPFGWFARLPEKSFEIHENIVKFLRKTLSAGRWPEPMCYFAAPAICIPSGMMRGVFPSRPHSLPVNQPIGGY